MRSLLQKIKSPPLEKEKGEARKKDPLYPPHPLYPPLLLDMTEGNN